MNKLNKLEKRILEVKYKTNENHIGSCLSALPIIEKIYEKMEKNDRFILSSGHAGVALYVVLEDRKILPKNVIYKLESHPKRNEKHKIWASTGSLGHGIGIAVGMALTGTEVHCLLSDGECAEGSVWEALYIADELGLNNLHIYVNANGWGGVDKIDTDRLSRRLFLLDLDISFIRTNSNFGPHRGLDAHYKSLTKKQYEALVC